jgi:transposase-like protein
VVKILDHQNKEISKMTPVTRRRYTAEFKAQAIQLVKMGTPVGEVAQELEISEGALRLDPQNPQRPNSEAQVREP